MELSIKMEYEETFDKEEASKLIKNSLYLCAVKMKELAIRKAPIDLGFLRNSIMITPNTKYSDTYIIYCGADYGLYIEFGTSPHWAPIKPLIEWAKRHGGNEGFGYAIRGKIAKEGIDAHPFFRPAYYELKDIWVKRYFKIGVENV